MKLRFMLISSIVFVGVCIPFFSSPAASTCSTGINKTHLDPTPGAFVDNTTLEINPTNGVQVKAGSIGANQLAPGSVVQVVHTQTGEVATGTTIILYDDTIPQNTEGTEFMSLAITPISATSKLKIDIVLFCSLSGAPDQAVVALFQDNKANALAAGVLYCAYFENGTSPIKFTHYMIAGTTSATTFKIRAGPNSTATITINGLGGARKLGGVMASSITITEIKN